MVNYFTGSQTLWAHIFTGFFLNAVGKSVIRKYIQICFVCLSTHVVAMEPLNCLTTAKKSANNRGPPNEFSLMMGRKGRR